MTIHLINVYLGETQADADLKQWVREAAARDGVSISLYVRRLLDGARKRDRVARALR
ncbi:MAG: hypothetical protein ABIJ75_07160 [Actinomycetota bacterium]